METPPSKWRSRLRLTAIGIVVVIAAVAAIRSQWQPSTGKDGAVAPHLESYQGQVPAPGMVTMVDLGANECVPCKMMAPILAKLEKEYRGKAVIAFYDVWKNREPAERFRIRAIPTQIFFDADGKEVARHEGFLDEKSIREQLKRIGVEPPEAG